MLGQLSECLNVSKAVCTQHLCAIVVPVLLQL